MCLNIITPKRKQIRKQTDKKNHKVNGMEKREKYEKGRNLGPISAIAFSRQIGQFSKLTVSFAANNMLFR